MKNEYVNADELIKEMFPKEYEEKKVKSILVVDDDPRVLRLIRIYLEDYQVAVATSGRVAIRYLENKTVDLILLDYEMPGEDGAQVLKRLHENPKTKDIPVVFLTGVADKKRIQEVLRLNPQGYVLKPVLRNKLLKIIDDVMK